MKFMLAISLSVWSFTALSGYQSAHNSEYFHGTGFLVDAAGNAQRYLISLAVKKKSASKYAFSYDIQLADKNIAYDFVAVHDSADSSFFSVYRKASNLEAAADEANTRSGKYQMIGYGYCWGPKCHFSYSWGEIDVENTIYRNRRTGHIHGMRSKSGKEGVVYIWKEVLKKIM